MSPSGGVAPRRPAAPVRGAQRESYCLVITGAPSPAPTSVGPAERAGVWATGSGRAGVGERGGSPARAGPRRGTASATWSRTGAGRPGAWSGPAARRLDAGGIAPADESKASTNDNPF
jgi:hypothetical protein